MEQPNQPQTDTAEEVVNNGCIQCGHTITVPGHAHKLCYECREGFIKYPIPRNIKLFAAGVGVIVLIALISLPAQLSTGIHLKRAEQAKRERRYATAEAELEKVLANEPDYTEALGNLMVTSYHNNKFEKVVELYKKLEKRNFDNKELLAEINGCLTGMDAMYPLELMKTLVETYKELDSVPDAEFANYYRNYPKDLAAGASYIRRLMDKEMYSRCDTLLMGMEKENADYVPGLMLHVSVKRQLKQFDSAMYYCNRLLRQNEESSFGLSAKARILLQQKQTAEGYRVAEQAYKLFPGDSYVRTTMVLAYHVNNKVKERDTLLKDCLKDSAGSEQAKYVSDVIGGKEQF
ncbi:hypothetical protein SAMN05421788_110100 [Filimonas lacunae]|uniref:Tetratricopeptide repeat-containing protein n=1 Tax=Filimonas lacunae TaxID=477680 RepID=A0A173MA04_9BACT|nr:tetratricopeptide repeat protein [Filimonas lacunae]BAV04373.1 tetratricopeptide TPR_2 [Filimonas lacunae]SIT31188.1 hypothetical protein SAMN05421788_110100 [Filimonas lacunae]